MEKDQRLVDQSLWPEGIAAEVEASSLSAAANIARQDQRFPDSAEIVQTVPHFSVPADAHPITLDDVRRGDDFW